MDFLILGPLEVTSDGAPLALGGGKQRALLADLLLSAGRTVATSRLIDDLWGEDVPDSATKMVQIYVSRLRKVLPAGVLVTTASGYLVELPPEQVDLFRFERLAGAGRNALAMGDPNGAAAALREALALWRGPALAEFDEPFAQTEARRLEELQLAALEERIDADLALSRHPDLVAEIEALVRRQPLRERLRGQLMLALYRSGRQAEALAAYQEARRTLSEELGIEPSAALRDLERRILNQDPHLGVLPLPHTHGRVASSVAAPAAGPARTTMVGRAAELSRLHDHLGRALDGARQMVFVVGEPGLGKTTLVQALVADAGAGPGPLVGLGQCIEQHGSGEAYLPVLDALDRLASGGDARVVSTLTVRAPTWLIQMPWLVDESEFATLQQRVLGATRDRMLREMLEALRAMAADHPLLLVLEDLHWSDPSTVELVGALARRAEPARIMLVGTFRPAEAGAGSHPIHALARELDLRGLAEVIPLEPLDEQDVHHYLAVRAPGVDLPGEVWGALRHRSGGNPLFLEKAVDAWIEEGKLGEDGGRFRILADPAALADEVPRTLVDLIRQRLDALSADDRSLLEAAAVAGPESSAALVASACEREALEVEARLDALGQSGYIITPRGDERWPDGTVAGRYGFTHDLCHEVLYADLPAGRRVRLHQRIAERIEAAFGDRASDLAGELAAHFVASGDGARALPHLVAAARRSLERRAPMEAIELARTGLAMLEGTTPGADREQSECALQQVLGSALVAVEGWSSADAEQALLRARDLAAAAGEDDARAGTTFMLATLYETRGEYDRSEQLLEDILTLPNGSSRPGNLVDSHEVLACSLFHQGSFERSLETAEQGLAIYDGIYANPLTATYGDNSGVSCHLWAALSLWFLGLADQAAARARMAVALAEAPMRRHGLATALAQAAVVDQCRRDIDSTREWATAAVEAATSAGFAYRSAMGTILEGWALAAGGDADVGIDHIRRGLDLSGATGVHMDDAYFLGLLGDACARAGRLDEALGVIEDALAVVPRAGRFFFGAELRRLRGEVLVLQGRTLDGEASLRHALEVAREQGSRALELRAAVTLGNLMRESGRGGEARALVAPVYASFTEGFETDDLRRAQALLEDLDPAMRG
jgi:DNA-binding SARP family transcriptional activator/predicted ATPase